MFEQVSRAHINALGQTTVEHLTVKPSSFHEIKSALIALLRTSFETPAQSNDLLCITYNMYSGISDQDGKSKGTKENCDIFPKRWRNCGHKCSSPCAVIKITLLWIFRPSSFLGNYLYSQLKSDHITKAARLPCSTTANILTWLSLTGWILQSPTKFLSY